MQSLGKAGRVRLRGKFVLGGLASKLQGPNVVDSTTLQKDGEGHSDLNLGSVHVVRNDQAVDFASRNRPLGADGMIFDTEAVSILCCNDAPSICVMRSGHRDERVREHCYR
jgi:hypothetical protein